MNKELRFILLLIMKSDFQNFAAIEVATKQSFADFYWKFLIIYDR